MTSSQSFVYSMSLANILCSILVSRHHQVHRAVLALNRHTSATYIFTLICIILLFKLIFYFQMEKQGTNHGVTSVLVEVDVLPLEFNYNDDFSSAAFQLCVSCHLCHDTIPIVADTFQHVYNAASMQLSSYMLYECMSVI